MRSSPKEIGTAFREALAMRTVPVGFSFSQEKPVNARMVKSHGSGCVMPLIFSSAKGGEAAFCADRHGWPCSGFYLGFRDWIFPGIECFLSQGLAQRECERFVRTPESARAYLESLRRDPPEKGYAVFKPLERCAPDERPEVAIFFVNPDQLAGLVFLAHYDAPLAQNRVVTGFASACGAVATLPLGFARRGERKAFWGMHDISARLRLPKELMTLAFPYAFLEELYAAMPYSFFTTSHWRRIKERNFREEGMAGRSTPDAPE